MVRRKTVIPHFVWLLPVYLSFKRIISIHVMNTERTILKKINVSFLVHFSLSKYRDQSR